MYKNMLPIGSVIKTLEGVRYLMICGRIVCAEGSDVIYDYVGCLYPEGIAGSDSLFFFNRDDIEKVLFIGFQDEQEIEFRTEILDNLKKLEVRDGEITEVEADSL